MGPLHNFDPLHLAGRQLRQVDYPARTSCHSLTIHENENAVGTDILDHDTRRGSQIAIE